VPYVCPSTAATQRDALLSAGRIDPEPPVKFPVGCYDAQASRQMRLSCRRYATITHVPEPTTSYHMPVTKRVAVQPSAWSLRTATRSASATCRTRTETSPPKLEKSATSRAAGDQGTCRKGNGAGLTQQAPAPQTIVLEVRNLLTRLTEPAAPAQSQRTTAIKLPPGNDRTSKSTFVQMFCIAAPIRTAPNSINCFIAASPDHRPLPACEID
jgi:hypothetical protein